MWFMSFGGFQLPVSRLWCRIPLRRLPRLSDFNQNGSTRTSHPRETERLISTATSMDLKLVSKVQFSVIQRGDTERPVGADYG